MKFLLGKYITFEIKGRGLGNLEGPSGKFKVIDYNKDSVLIDSIIGGWIPLSSILSVSDKLNNGKQEMKFLIGKKVRATVNFIHDNSDCTTTGDAEIIEATEEQALIRFCSVKHSPEWIPYNQIEKIYDESPSGDNHNSRAPGNITASEVRIRQQEHAREMAKMEMVSFLFPTENKKLPPIGSGVEVSLGKGEVKAHGNAAGRPVIFVQGFGWTETTCNWTELKGD